MKRLVLHILLGLFITFVPSCLLTAQEIIMNRQASVEQVYEESQSSEELLSMNELGMDSGGYALYETKIITEATEAILELENVRDYAVVYLDGKRIGELNNDTRTLTFPVTEGNHSLCFYVENIGRITYGPEILDNSKGLFGTAELNGESLTDWVITPLAVQSCDVNQLDFTSQERNGKPCFHQGSFVLEKKEGIYLDISGWGMGEIWLNGEYIGTYWEQDPQQTLSLPASLMKNGENVLTVFELKDSGKQSMQLTNKPIFK